jgi:N-acylneuraminate cytidylyltransferase
MKILGLIPARSGSKRVPGKNMAMLNGKPLLQYAIDGAVESKVFDEIVVTSNWDECLTLAKLNGVRALNRPAKLCRDESHDFEFVKHAFGKYRGFDCFAILRPTSPFRTAVTIKRAMDTFFDRECDSMRAVGPTCNHPRKSWKVADGYLEAYHRNDTVKGFPAYDMPTQALGPVYCQNGCIHIAWVETVEKYGNVSGKTIRAFFTEGWEGLDINSPADLAFAEMLMLSEDINRERGIA